MQEVITKEQVDEFLKDLYLTVEMPDLNLYAIPLKVIADNRAKYFAQWDEITYDESLYDDTIPLFMAETYEIEDWASNNMDWDDVKEYAIKIETKAKHEYDFQDGWMNGNKEILKKQL